MIKIKLNTTNLNCNATNGRYTAAWCKDLPENIEELSEAEQVKIVYPYIIKLATEMGFPYSAEDYKNDTKFRRWYFYKSADILSNNQSLEVTPVGAWEPEIKEFDDAQTAVLKKANYDSSGWEIYKQYDNNFVVYKAVSNSKIGAVLPYVFKLYQVDRKPYHIPPYDISRPQIITPEQADNKVPVNLRDIDWDAWYDYEKNQDIYIPITNIQTYFKNTRQWTTKYKKYVAIYKQHDYEETEPERLTQQEAEEWAKKLSLQYSDTHCVVHLKAVNNYGDFADSNASNITWYNGKPYEYIELSDLWRYVD